LGLPIWLSVETSHPAMSLSMRMGFVPVDDNGIYTRMRRHATSGQPAAEWAA
jgi:hypothetical protein